MTDQSQSHNLLIVSDMHIAEGLQAEAGECCYGLEAFLYDGAFARFLRYHEQMRRDAVREGDDQLARPWRLVLAGDVFDFWDVVRVPGDTDHLLKAIEDKIQEFGSQMPAAQWLDTLRIRLTNLKAEGPDPWDYNYVRDKLDELKLEDGRQRRAVESLTWWTEVLVEKDTKLSPRERRHGLSTTWQEVVWKLTHIYRGHIEFFAALAWFIACGNQVILIKGNHDIELYWPQVHDGHLPHLLIDAYRELRCGGPQSPTFGSYPPELLAELDGGPLPNPDAFCKLLPTHIVFENWFYCEPDLVYIEHGNQYEPADSSICLGDPRMPSAPDHIELPWGAFMVRYFYNKIIAIHPFAVNVKPEQRIIHWMIHNDLFRLLGIILAELIDILRALVRAVKQGLRGTWIWGDHSISGLIPLLIYDLIELRISKQQSKEQRTNASGSCHRSGIAGSGAEAQSTSPSANQASQEDDDVSRWAQFLLHLGTFCTILCLLLAGMGWLFGWAWTAWLTVPTIVFAILAIASAALCVHLDKKYGRHRLGELLLQVGVVGAITGLIAYLFLAKVLGWTLATGFLVVLIPLATAAAGLELIRTNRKNQQGHSTSRLFRGNWQAKSLRSGASLFVELGLLAIVIGSFYLFGSAESKQAGPWLRAAIALFICGWAADRLHIVYVSQGSLDRLASRSSEGLQQGFRNVSTVLVVLLALALLLAPAAWLADTTIQFLFAEGGPKEAKSISEFAAQVYEFMTTQRFFAMPILVTLLLTIVSIILVETGVWRLIQRWRDWRRTSDSPKQTGFVETGVRWLIQRWHTGVRWLAQRWHDWMRTSDGTATSLRPIRKDQLEGIEELARVEQRRWLGSLLSFLILLLPFVAAVLLAMSVAGGVATLLNIVRPLLETVALFKALGISILFGFAYWLLRQISATTQRHDPQSGFGDLFYRMAISIADILEATENGSENQGLGRPLYFVFGHDHWADSKPLPECYGVDAGTRQQWYVNAGTWLRGYVEEQRRQEVNENHSTFVQIIPRLSQDEAPRVLRWNDGANQPERIIRREEPESVNGMIWSRLEGSWPSVLLWGILLGATWRLAPPGWMTALWPLIWILGLWLLSWALVGIGRKLVRGR